MIGRRCNVGCETWPDDDKYEYCPVCREPTKRFSNMTPLDESEARAAAFEAFYAEWDKRPAVRLKETPEETLRWDTLYPGGKPDEPEADPSG